MTPTRRSFLLLPALGLLPNRTQSKISLPERIPVTRLLLGGDVMLSRYVGALARQREDPAWPLREVADLFASADIAFVNLEAPFSDRGKPVESGMIFKAEPEMIAALELAGIDIVSTANNHARDCDGYGVEFTLNWLTSHGIAAVGSAKSADAAHAGAVLTRNGTRFGFLAYTYDQSNGNHPDLDDRIAALDADQMRSDVREMLGGTTDATNAAADRVREPSPGGVPAAKADVVIVSMHAGVEYAPKPNREQIEFAQAAIDAGARVVVGHHPHVVQPWERVGESVIFYSLGNLVFDQFQREETQHGALAQVRFAGPRLVDAEMVPVDIARTGPRLAGIAPEIALRR